MSNLDDILESLKGQQPMIDDPDALTDRIMSSLPDLEPYPQENEGKARFVSIRWRWTAAAACLLIIIGMGGAMWLKEEPQQSMIAEATIAKKENNENVIEHSTQEITKMVTTKRKPSTENSPMVSPSHKGPNPATDNPSDSPEKTNDINEPENLHYVAVKVTDEIPYQDPARVDEFIAKLADFNEVEVVLLDCDLDNNDSTVVSKAYVFEDSKELDLFGRLLQVAYWYDSKTPGYLLNYTHQQLYFTLKDMRRGQKYLWIAERINGGRILLQSTRSVIDVIPSAACHQDYRNKLTLPGIHNQQNI